VSIPKLQSTSNYDLFVPSEFNRDLRSLKALKESMKKHGYIAAHPLHCIKGPGGKLIIKAGHHRFETAKSLGIPIWYVVCDDQSEIPELEGTLREWSFKDYITSYARAGSADHLAIIEYTQRTGISHRQAASLLSGECATSGNVAKKVKRGGYSLKPNSHSEKLATIVTGLRDIGVPFYNNSNFVSALSSVSWLNEFDQKTFLHRSAGNLHLFVKQSTRDQFLELIDRVYNFQAKHRIALSFLAKEAARKRCVVSKEKDADGDSEPPQLKAI